MMDEGYLKFNCKWIKEQPFSEEDVEAVNAIRDQLYQFDLIGMDQSGIGYGNISVRSEKGIFLISGSATGGLSSLSTHHYSLVTYYDFASNKISCRGITKASSESLSHAAIYDFDSSYNAVIHVHDLVLWETYKGVEPTTSESIEYGTSEMAQGIQHVLSKRQARSKRFMVMGGHKEGILSFGRTLDEAIDVLLDYYQPLHLT